MQSYHAVKEEVLQVLRSGKVPHAILITGSDEEKRAAISELIACFAVCTGSEGRPCLTCAGCSKVKKGIHPDIKRETGTGAARSLHIDAIRSIREDAYVIPNEAEYKVYLIDGADKMTVQAQNALLKILEEPPRSVLFVLTAQSSLSLLETIRSRVTVFMINEETVDLKQEKEKELCQKIAAAICQSTEFELLAACSPFIKDRTLFRSVTELLFQQFRDALLFTLGALEETSEETKLLSEQLTKKALLKLTEEMTEIRKMIDQNANLTLLSTCFCAKMRTAATL